ncbi:MAG: iron ABC transporter permease [Anaerolineae bacterium]|nr:iron ABC transporter permease [Anaerolineae bacterium]
MAVTNIKLALTFKPRSLHWAYRVSVGRRPPLFLVLGAMVVVGAVVLPFIYLLGRASGAGLSQMANILLRPRTLEILLNSIGLALSATLAAVMIGVVLAWLTVRTDLPGRKFWAVIAVLPLALPSYVGAFTLIAALGPRGLLQGWLAPLGVERLLSIYGFPGALLTLTVFTYPYVLLSVRAGLRGLDASLEQVAQSLGRSPFRVFYEITLPHLRPSILAGGLLVALYTLSDFGAVSLLRFDSFTRAIYLQYSASFDRSAAAVLGLLLVVLAGLILFFEGWMRGQARAYCRSAGSICQPPLVKLGRWRWPALAFSMLVVMLGVILPLLVIGFWLVRGWVAGEVLNLRPEIILNSVFVSALAAGVAIMAALPVALLAVRFPNRASVWLERSTYLGYALPGIVIALALVFLGANYIPLLYQTLALLIFAYVVRFLPQAVGSARASLLQVNPCLEEAAGSLGYAPWQVLRAVTVPLLRPGLMVGLVLFFLTSIKELPMTLLLGPTGFQTLATRIWNATEGAFFARAAVPALLLVMASAVSIWIILGQEEKRARNL